MSSIIEPSRLAHPDLERGGRRLASASVAGVGVAFPASRSQSELWDGFFADHFEHDRRIRGLWHNCGIDTRHAVVDPLDEDVRGWGTEARMRRFQAEALGLGIQAVSGALADAGVAGSDVDQLTVVTCTGYGTPGLDINLAKALDLPDHLQRFHIGHMGCFAAVPGLTTVADAVRVRHGVAVMLCIELTSLHVQPPSDGIEQAVSHALFSDGAAATVVVPDGPGLEMVDVVSRTDADSTSHMTWDVTDMGFRMGISPKVPEVLGRHVASVVEDLLARNDLTVGDVAGWAVHPGGPAILDVVAEKLGIEDQCLDEARTVLREHGNCSSGTAMMVLDEVRRRRDLSTGDPVVLMAFGPGLTLYAALLRQR